MESHRMITNHICMLEVFKSPVAYIITISDKEKKRQQAFDAGRPVLKGYLFPECLPLPVRLLCVN